MKNRIEMIINVRDLTNCNELIELDLMNTTETKRKYDAFKKEHEGNKFYIRFHTKFYKGEPLLIDNVGVREIDFIEWILDWAEEYLQEWAEEYLKNWDEEQINQFSNLVQEGYDWERATEIVEKTKNSKRQAKS